MFKNLFCLLSTVCVSGLDYDEQRFGTATYESVCLSVCVFLCLYPGASGLSKQCRRIWVGLNYSLAQPSAVGHHFGAADRLEEDAWGCCDRPALCYQWVYNAHRVKTQQIR